MTVQNQTAAGTRATVYELNTSSIAAGETFSPSLALEYLCEVVNENRDTFDELLNTAPPKKTEAGDDGSFIRAAHWETLVAAQSIVTGAPFVTWKESRDSLHLQLFGITEKIPLTVGDILYWVADLLYHHRKALYATLGKTAGVLAESETRNARLTEAICIAEIILDAAGEGAKKDRPRLRRIAETWSVKANRHKSRFIAAEAKAA